MDIILRWIEEYGHEAARWIRDYWIVAIWYIPIAHNIRLQNLDLAKFKPAGMFHSKQLVITKQVLFDYVLYLLASIVVYAYAPKVVPFLLSAFFALFRLLQSIIRSANEYVCERDYTTGKTSFQEITFITWNSRGITINHKKGRFKNLFLNGSYGYKSYAGISEFVDDAKRNGVPVFMDYQEEMIRRNVNPFAEDKDIGL